MPPLMSSPFNTDTELRKWQADRLSDVLAELLSDDNPHSARKAIAEAIENWADYHKKELDKWTSLRNLLSL